MVNHEYKEATGLNEMTFRKHRAFCKHPINIKDVDNDLDHGPLILLSDPQTGSALRAPLSAATAAP